MTQNGFAKSFGPRNTLRIRESEQKGFKAIKENK